MSIEQIVQINNSPRLRLRQLDGVLDDLEDLNLRDIAAIPTRLGRALMDLGVANPYAQTITELIERVFDLQEPVLVAVRSRSGATRSMRTAG